MRKVNMSKAMLDEKKLPFLDDIKYRTNSHDKIVKDPRYKMAFGSLSIVAYAIIILLILFLIWTCGTAHFGKADYHYRQWSGFFKNDTTFSLPDFAPPDPTEDILKERVSEMCYVKPFGLKIIQYALLAQLVYVDLTEWENDAIFQSITKDFFPNTSNVQVSQLKLDDFEKYYGAITLFHFRDLNLKVFSIRRSYSGSDWALDIQLLLSSALLYVASPLTMFLSNSIPKTKKGIRQLMVFPLVLTKSINLVEKYYDTYTEFYDDHYDNEFNIVAVGH